MSRFFITVLFLSLTANAFAEKTTLHLCNDNPDRKIYAAYLKQTGGGAGWQSVGWFGVDATKCRDIDVGTYTGKMYVYADDEFHETNWGEGEPKFCVNKINAFSINNADTTECAGADLKKVKSDEYTLVSGVNNITFKPNFASLKFCNKNTQYAVYAAFAKKMDDGSWQSKGWYLVDKGGCRTTAVGKYSGDVRVYAEYNGGEVSFGAGPDGFCVNKTSAFLLDSADDANKCSGSDLKMISSSTQAIQTGVNEVTFEVVPLKTLLNLCNKTTDKNIQASYGTRSSETLFSNKGWVQLSPGSCKEVDLGEYVGKGYIYGEANGGDIYWGSGPLNLCVDKTADFTFGDAGNPTECNSNIKYKMIPTTVFDLIQGHNTFSFQP